MTWSEPKIAMCWITPFSRENLVLLELEVKRHLSAGNVITHAEDQTSASLIITLWIRVGSEDWH